MSSQADPETSFGSRHGVPPLSHQSKSIEPKGTVVTQGPLQPVSPSQALGNKPHEVSAYVEVPSRSKGNDSRSKDSARATSTRQLFSPHASSSAAAEVPGSLETSNKTTAPKEQLVPKNDALKPPEGGKVRSGSASQTKSKPAAPVPPQDDPLGVLTEEVPDSWLVSPQVMQHIMKRRATAQAAADEKAREAVIAEALATALAVPTRKRTLPSNSVEYSTQDATQSKNPSFSDMAIPGDNEAEAEDVKPSPRKKVKTSRTAAITGSASESKSASAVASSSKAGAASSVAKGETARTTRQSSRTNVPVKSNEPAGPSSSTGRGRGKGGTSRASKDPVKEALALTKTMNYAQYIAYIEENGPIRGGRKSNKFEGLVMFYLVQEGTSNKLGEVSRGRLDFVSFTKSGVMAITLFTANFSS